VILSETLFHRGQAVGLVTKNTDSGQVQFLPPEGRARLARRRWASAKACRKAVTNYYRKEQGNE